LNWVHIWKWFLNSASIHVNVSNINIEIKLISVLNWNSNVIIPKIWARSSLNQETEQN
jgi:hypothetical protein